MRFKAQFQHVEESDECNRSNDSTAHVKSAETFARTALKTATPPRGCFRRCGTGCTRYGRVPVPAHTLYASGCASYTRGWHRIRLVASMRAAVMHRPNCHPVMHTVQPRGWCSGCRSSQTTRAPYWYMYMYVHTPRHPGGHSSGRPSPSHTWHHSCRTYFVMYICVLRDLTGTTRLCDHIVRMLLAALSGVTAHTGETSGEEVRGGSGPQTPRPHRARDQTRSGKTSSAAGRTAGLLACWFEKIEIYPTRAK